MIRSFFIPAFIFLFPAFVLAANGDVAISEILFDPVGTDTGLEYVVVKNFGTSDINLTGWDLYPAGAGYFIFPNFTLASGAEVKIRIRTSGEDDGANLHHAAATGNMGNSSGSVALFSSTAHSKDTIVSYMRYHKPGSSESKTWESVASDSGIWSAGDLIDISNLSEGQILKLQNTGQKMSSQGWVIASSETLEAPPAAPPGANSGSENDQVPSTQGGNVEAANSVSKIKANAGEDRTVLAGAEVSFFGSADGFTEDSVNKARFIWNFGDGNIGEGKAAAHVFAYPGVYTIFLTVSFAGVSSSDSAQVMVVENPVVLSEIKPVAWIEIHNNSARKIDFSNFGITVGSAKPFYFPANTFLAPWTYLALGSSALGFEIPSTGEAKLLYPNGKTLFGSIYPNLYLDAKESVSFANGSWARSKATPGAKNEVIKIVDAPATTAKKPGFFADSRPGFKEGADENVTEIKLASVLPPSTSNVSPLFDGKYLWLIAGLGAGILAGLIFVFAKRYFL